MSSRKVIVRHYTGAKGGRTPHTGPSTRVLSPLHALRSLTGHTVHDVRKVLRDVLRSVEPSQRAASRNSMVEYGRGSGSIPVGARRRMSAGAVPKKVGISGAGLCAVSGATGKLYDEPTPVRV